jgi:DNA repair protein RecO (recombination protein O)
MLTGAALFNGFYLNELLLKLIARHDPHAGLFDVYAATLAALGGGETGAQAALRSFEIVLLKETGLLPDLGLETSTGRPLAPERRYRVLADAGVVAAAEPGEATASGTTLLAVQAALASADLGRLRQAAAAALAELRPILRAQLHYHLGTDNLRTRRVMRDAQALMPPR